MVGAVQSTLSTLELLKQTSCVYFISSSAAGPFEVYDWPVLPDFAWR